MPASPPSKYTSGRLAKARAYLKKLPEGDVVHSIVGMAIAMGVCEETLFAWEKDPEKTEIIRYLKEVRNLQKTELLNRGLSGSYNPTIAKLMLTKHGYSDKVDTTQAGPDGGPVQHEIKAIVSDMSDEEATRIYQERLSGN